MHYTEEELSALRLAVSQKMSAKRFSHTCAVERSAERLGNLLLPKYVSELRAAALLHDVTKELTRDKQLKILERMDVRLSDDDLESDGVLHSFTAPLFVKEHFPKYAIDNILGAIEKHTVGSEDMSVFEKIIFISDYAEDTRTYGSCIRVREALFDKIESLSYEERIKRLDDACLMSIDGALAALEKDKRHINERIYATKKSFLKKKLQN